METFQVVHDCESGRALSESTEKSSSIDQNVNGLGSINGKSSLFSSLLAVGTHDHLSNVSSLQISQVLVSTAVEEPEEIASEVNSQDEKGEFEMCCEDEFNEIPNLQPAAQDDFYYLGEKYSFAYDYDTSVIYDPLVEYMLQAVSLDSLSGPSTEAGQVGIDRYLLTQWKSDSTRYFHG